MESNSIFAILCLCCGIEFTVGSICHTNGDWWYDDETYCSNGCCGVSPDEYCCDIDLDVGTINIGTIVGGAIGGIILLSILITIVCVVCQKSQRRPGHVVQPALGTAVIMAHNQQGYGMAQRPQYPPQPNAGPSYGINPAYPPPYPGNSDNAPPPPPKY